MEEKDPTCHPVLWIETLTFAINLHFPWVCRHLQPRWLCNSPLLTFVLVVVLLSSQTRDGLCNSREGAGLAATMLPASLFACTCVGASSSNPTLPACFNLSHFFPQPLYAFSSQTFLWLFLAGLVFAAQGVLATQDSGKQTDTWLWWYRRKYPCVNVEHCDVVLVGSGTYGTYTAIQLRDMDYSSIIEQKNRLVDHAETDNDAFSGIREDIVELSPVDGLSPCPLACLCAGMLLIGCICHGYLEGELIQRIKAINPSSFRGNNCSDGTQAELSIHSRDQ